MALAAPQINCPANVSSLWLPWEEELAFCPSSMFVDRVTMLTKTDHPGHVFPTGERGQNALLLAPWIQVQSL